MYIRTVPSHCLYTFIAGPLTNPRFMQHTSIRWRGLTKTQKKTNHHQPLRPTLSPQPRRAARVPCPRDIDIPIQHACRLQSGIIPQCAVGMLVTISNALHRIHHTLQPKTESPHSVDQHFINQTRHPGRLGKTPPTSHRRYWQNRNLVDQL